MYHQYKWMMHHTPSILTSTHTINTIVSADPSGWQGERAGEGLANAPGPSFRALLFCCGEEAVSELCCFGFYSAAILG